MHLLPIKFSDEEITQIMDLAACNYSPEKVAIQMGIDKKQFVQLYTTPGSDVREAYEAGKLKATFNIMNKQKELAESGNITAAQIFLKESERIAVENCRNQCLFGNDY